MISGECPYDDCDGGIWLPMPGVGGVWAKHTCETCGRAFWEHYSRWDPHALTETDFDAQYTVDEDTKQITPRNRAATSVSGRSAP